MRRFVIFALLFIANMAMGRPVLPESGYSDSNGAVRVSVYIDLEKEKNLKFIEGTAMLRASRLLHKARPELPPKYNVSGRVLTNVHNRVEKIFTYIVEYDQSSIDAVVKQAVEDAEKERIENERLAAERAKNAELIVAKDAVEKSDNAVSELQLTNNVNELHRELETNKVEVAVRSNNCDKAIEEQPGEKKKKKNGFCQVDVDSFGGIDPMED